MRRCAVLVLAALAAFTAAGAAPGPDLASLNVLYVGEEPASARARQFTEFLQKKVRRVEVFSRAAFQPAQARDFDVVLLDWPPSGRVGLSRQAPLGDRLAWTKPTVLLGSAGLNLAAAWQVRGGSG